ncbi:DUF1772 domain-containing protein [Hymenobacter sp. ASUV-10]|uniref:DUF1772 domain-containing protein n=1 Tax=Hymenobacter aranciens TaxID=3063996 RepID=A0ABT9BD34_9BACT|nr:anthrone oxygenase family protein [Hymenobacter sp. ASUV-10]MDO7874947.1 DUF1772 domain-containing protein [Hymenobacter sp. ASUV-10]
MTGKNLVLALATLSTGLVAGVYYGFSVAVNPAFARLPDAQYIRAMQEINDAIQNPFFAASFFGAPLLLVLATGLHAGRPRGRQLGLVLAATLVFWVGSLGVTVGGNIPLNEQLARYAPGATASAAAVRQQFVPPWNRWHRVRTGASVVALALLLSACLLPDAATKQA